MSWTPRWVAGPGRSVGWGFSDLKISDCYRTSQLQTQLSFYISFKALFGMSLLEHKNDFYSINYGILKFFYRGVFGMYKNIMIYFYYVYKFLFYIFIVGLGITLQDMIHISIC